MNRSRTARKPLIGCAQLIAALAAVVLGARELHAQASYSLELQDARGIPLEHAVLALFAADAPPAASGSGEAASGKGEAASGNGEAASGNGEAPLEPSERPRPQAVMDQREHQFAPHVLAVRAGTEVSFPNSDRTRHHVYSFSPAKRFELKLYKGVPSQPVLFDRAGPVVLGCNIHDHMIGYIYVLETPLFATSGADGRASIQGLAPGRYRAQLWHPGLLAQGPRELGEFALAAGEQRAQSLRLELEPSAPRPDEENSLQRRFKRRDAP